MKKILILLALAFGMVVSAKALTYEEAFDTVKALPQMKGVQGTVINGNNDFSSIGITNGELVLWDNEGRNKQKYMAMPFIELWENCRCQR